MMKYRKDKYGRNISQLGYGCMRFTKNGGSIDYEKAEKEVLYAIEKGVNYFDTAYIYPGNEECLGKILQLNNVRNRVYIATKLPQYIIRTIDAAEKIFTEELRRLRTDYIDYYLMHMFTDYAEWENLLSIGIENWIAKLKNDGKIRNIGFSYHGDTDMFLKILNAYDWDFCQIQYNYLDEHTQAGRRGLTAAHEKGVPVIIMEPLRGGKLVNIPDAAKKIMASSTHRYTPAQWGLRWLWDQAGVTSVLSGMNSLEMVRENIKTASDASIGDFTPNDFKVIDEVKKVIREREKVRCTACRYCMPCPRGVDIPGIFHYWNLLYIEERKKSARLEFARNIGLRKKTAFASQCVGCGLCESRCPQKINIRNMLKEADRELRPLLYKIGISIARKIMKK